MLSHAENTRTLLHNPHRLLFHRCQYHHLILDHRVHVLSNGSAAPSAENLPMTCVLELAYEGLDQDPFKSYDPFDFDLADQATHLITVSGATVSGHQGGTIGDAPRFIFKPPTIRHSAFSPTPPPHSLMWSA